MKVSIVIPNYNGATLLKENLPSVQKAAEEYTKHTGEEAELIVTDDGSQDESKGAVDGFQFPIRYLEHKENKGFATNVNRGVKAASGEILVLLNTDVSPEKDFLAPLISHFSDETVFAVGCLDRSIERGKEVHRGRGVGNWKRGFLIHRAGALEGTRTLWASGGSSAFRRSLWNELGGLDEVFDPYYWEDIDLSYRAWKRGYSILFERDSIVIHEHEEGTIRKSQTSQRIQRIAYRNQFLFVWKNASSFLLFKHICWLPYHLFHAILRRDGNFFLGLLAAFMKLPRTIDRRGKEQSHIKVSDTEVIERSSK